MEILLYSIIQYMKSSKNVLKNHKHHLDMVTNVAIACGIMFSIFSETLQRISTYKYGPERSCERGNSFFGYLYGITVCSLSFFTGFRVLLSLDCVIHLSSP